MPGQKEDDKPSRATTIEGNIGQDTRSDLYSGSAAHNHLAPFPGERIFNTLHTTPQGEDPLFWPIHVMHELNRIIIDREDATNPQLAALGEQWTPDQEAMRRVRTAYEIIAYPLANNRSGDSLLSKILRQIVKFMVETR